jgi:leucyl aminopeptidase
MKFDIFSQALPALPADCLVAGVYDNGVLGSHAAVIDKASGGALSRLLKRGDHALRLGETALLGDLPGIKSPRVLLVGQGSGTALSRRNWRKAVTQATIALSRLRVAAVACALERPPGRDLDDYLHARSFADAVGAALYQVNDQKTARKPHFNRPERILLGPVRAAAAAATRAGLAHGAAMTAGQKILRDLGNLPANRCTPTHVANFALGMARELPKLKVKVLDEAAIRAEKMACLLAVAQGSEQAPRFIVLEYRGGKPKDAPIALVGKGVTFDSGGISLKDPAAMDEMKFDMCGAASVLATLSVVAQLKLPVNVVGVVPCCENMPSGRAVKPGDVIISAAGHSVEILNTDAEGRLILCDALHYARRFKPRLVLDIATLTGACVVALGAHHTGVFGNDAALATALVASGLRADDRAWHMPITEEYAEQLKSNFADFANVAGRDGGAITAAAFLGKFTQGLRWAHLDIAGTAWQGGASKGATGRPLGLLADFLIGESGRTPGKARRARLRDG